MKRICLLAWILSCGCLSLGCSSDQGAGAQGSTPQPTAGRSDNSSAAAGKETLGPREVVQAFLEAFQAGDPQGTAKYLTTAAREDAQRHGLEISPPGSAAALFEVGEMEYVGEGKDAAHVATNYTEPDASGQSVTRVVVWGLKREEEGWRIAGMAIKVFEDAPPLFLNFEDQEEMQQKLQMVQQEMARRIQLEGAADPRPGEAHQAQQPSGRETR